MLSYLVRISLNQQHQTKHMFTMAWISAGVVREDIANETVKCYAALMEIL